MANPTTAKPAASELASGHALFAAIKAKVPVVESTTGVIRETVSNTLSRPGYTSSSASQLAGPPPAIDPTGGPDAGPSLIFGWSRLPLWFAEGTGYGNDRPSTYTCFAVFKPITPTGTLNGSLQCWVVSSSQFGGAGGLGFSLAASGGALTLNALRNQDFVSSGLTLTSGHTYAAAVTLDDSQSSKTLTFWIYDYTTQSLISATDGTVVDLGAVANAALTSNSGLVIGGLFGAANAFLGGIADVGLYGDAFSDALFQGYYQDPWGLDRGTYSPTGSLTAGEAWVYSSDDTTTWVGATRPTGGTLPYTYQWYRSATSNFTPGGGNLLSGATSLRLADTPPTTATAWWYKLVATDSAGTPASVTYTQVGAFLRPKPDFRILEVGDSIHQVSPPLNAGTAMEVALAASGRRVIAHRRAVSGSSTDPASWGTSGTILASAVSDAVADGVELAEVMLGANDANGSNAATYQTQLGAILTYLLGHGITKVILHWPTPGAQPGGGNEAINANLQAYQGAIANLIADDPAHLFLGDTNNWRVMMDVCWAFTGIFHPDGDLAVRIGDNWARAVLAVVDPATYTAAANVRSGTNRGDGVTGTLSVPSAANVRSGTAVDATTGTLVAPSPANTKVGVAGDGGTGTYDGSDRWTDPGVSAVQSGTTYKANSTTSNRTGTYDPVTGNYTDPGVANVVEGTAYSFAGSSLTGTHVDSGGGITPQEIVDSLYDSILVNDTTFRAAMQAVAAVAAGENDRTEDGSSSTFKDINDPDTTRITSVNTATLRTPTVH